MLNKKILLIGVFLLMNSFPAESRAGKNKTVILATTTSVQDTGLLEILVERFNQKSGYLVKAVAVGTGQALRMGRLGEVDLLWVHSPDEEEQFVKDGYGLNRTTFMHNEFVLLGPAADPAKIKGRQNVFEAFRKIARSKVLFVSRGDNSGTNKKELKIWAVTGMKPDQKKYLESGQGMAATLRLANEKQAYCLADSSSYLALKKTIALIVLLKGGRDLINSYSLILVNSQKFPKVNAQGAKAFFDFLLSPESKKMVDNFGRKQFGEQLFFYDFHPRRN